ncbi:MAG: hypothetical protein DRN14_00325 [Thermoplasmata archaeon]|nr:ferredoxin family protein [Thermoplasmata archaeon]RLF30234.1 MAG: hypothetical protein DRN14_00325 [Thermoplasmata archaeon]
MHPVIDESLCKRCMICVWVCPKGVFEGEFLSLLGSPLPEVARPSDCINWGRSDTPCELCMLSCPEHAIEYVPEGGS